MLRFIWLPNAWFLLHLPWNNALNHEWSYIWLLNACYIWSKCNQTLAKCNTKVAKKADTVFFFFLIIPKPTRLSIGAGWGWIIQQLVLLYLFSYLLVIDEAKQRSSPPPKIKTLPRHYQKNLVLLLQIFQAKLQKHPILQNAKTKEIIRENFTAVRFSLHYHFQVTAFVMG